jgi:hypothetical protein
MKFKDYTDSILKEMSGLSRLHEKTQKYTCGIITAFTSENTYEENINRNRKLSAYLIRKKYSVTKVIGSYIEDYKTPDEKEVKEVSFFVANENLEGDDGGELLEDLKKLGEHFDQESILYVPYNEDKTEGYLVGTSKKPDLWLGYHEKSFVGFPRYGTFEDIGEFFSKIRGRAIEFKVKECVDIQLPTTNNGWLGLKLLSDKLEKELNEV